MKSHLFRYDEMDQDRTPTPTKSVRDLRTQDPRVLAPMGVASKHTPRITFKMTRSDPVEQGERTTPLAVQEIERATFGRIAHLIDYDDASPTVQRHLAEIISEGVTIARQHPKISLQEANRRLEDETQPRDSLANRPGKRAVKISEVVEIRRRAKITPTSGNVVEEYEIDVTSASPKINCSDSASSSSSSSSSSAPRRTVE